MRLLVTGGTGFIGRAFIPLLVDSGQDVEITLLVRPSYGPDTLLPPPLAALNSVTRRVFADLGDLEQTSRAVGEARPDCVVHLASAGVTDPFLDLDSAIRHNVTGTTNLLRACFDQHGGVQQFVVGRTPGELSHMNVYAASKAAAWSFCQMYARTRQWPICGAMIFQTYGPGQPDKTLIPAAIKAARAGQDFPMTAGTQQRDWIFVDDVAAGLSAMMNASLPPGSSIDLGTGRLTSVAEVVGRIYELTGGNGSPQFGAIPSRPGEEPLQVADAATSLDLIGWKAAVGLTEGLSRLLPVS